MHFVNAVKENSLSLNIDVGMSPPTDLLVFKSFMTFLTSSTVTGLKENEFIFLYFLLISLILGWFLYFSTILSILQTFSTGSDLSAFSCRLRFFTILPKYELKVTALIF